MKALISFSYVNNYEPTLLEAIEKVNENQLDHIIEILREELGSIDNKKIAVLGLSFKAGTSDTRNSRAIELVKRLILLGAIVRTHDPVVKISDLPPEVRETFTNDLEAIIRDVDAVVVATEWDIYKGLSKLVEKSRNNTLVVVDARRILDIQDVKQIDNLRFRAIGLSKEYRGGCLKNIEKS